LRKRGQLRLHALQSSALDERVTDIAWWGYFGGVKGELVFFDQADGTDGGLLFGVFDAKTGRKIFEDSEYRSEMWTRKPPYSPFNRLRISSAKNSHPVLRYLRVVRAECDLHDERAACWEQVRKRYKIKSPEVPVCSDYKGINTRWESAVAYPVEVTLDEDLKTKTIAGPVKCWPVD
jgi:hypothetical protein